MPVDYLASLPVMSRLAVLAVLAAILLLPACAAGPDIGELGLGSTAAVDVPIGPAGSAFYTAPVDAAGAEAGELIWVRRIEAPDGGEGYGILYWSTARDGSLVPVSGVLFVPVGATQPMPVVAWAHGTEGLGDGCAPSVGFFAGEGDLDALAAHAIESGAVFVATDYQGLGTPGEHPYMVNELSARNVLDSIRAAARFTATPNPVGLLLGQSQGASAVLYATEIQPTYAPDVALQGAAALSVPYGLTRLADSLQGSESFGYVLMTVHGYGAVYPELEATEAGLTPVGRTALDTIGAACIGQIFEEYAGRSDAEFGLASVLDAPPFQAELSRNDLGRMTPAVPVFIGHGELDDVIPLANAQALKEAYCAAGVVVEGRIYPGAGHVDVLSAASDDLLGFLDARATGQQPVTSCD